MDEWFAPFDSKQYLVVKRGYLCLENSRIDAHEFRRLVRKAHQQVANLEYWPAEITFSSAFSLWQGKFVPADFGVDAAVVYQDEIEQIYLEASQTFARLLAENRPPSTSVETSTRVPALRSYQRWRSSACPTNYAWRRTSPGQANQLLMQYSEALFQREVSPHRRSRTSCRISRSGKPRGGWFSIE